MKKFHGGEVLRKRKHQMPDYSYLCIQHYLLFRNRAFPLILMLLRKYLKICHILVINKKTHGLVFFRFSIHAISLTYIVSNYAMSMSTYTTKACKVVWNEKRKETRYVCVFLFLPATKIWYNLKSFSRANELTFYIVKQSSCISWELT